jgi:hypothetical protein
MGNATIDEQVQMADSLAEMANDTFPDFTHTVGCKFNIHTQ